jgi:hypothetical protein
MELGVGGVCIIEESRQDSRLLVGVERIHCLFYNIICKTSSASSTLLLSSWLISALSC